MEGGGSITLSCSVAEGVPTPEIRWDKLNPEEISLPINMEGQNLNFTLVGHTVTLIVALSMQEQEPYSFLMLSDFQRRVK